MPSVICSITVGCWLKLASFNGDPISQAAELDLWPRAALCGEQGQVYTVGAGEQLRDLQRVANWEALKEPAPHRSDATQPDEDETRRAPVPNARVTQQRAKVSARGAALKPTVLHG